MLETKDSASPSAPRKYLRRRPHSPILWSVTLIVLALKLSTLNLSFDIPIGTPITTATTGLVDNNHLLTLCYNGVKLGNNIHSKHSPLKLSIPHKATTLSIVLLLCGDVESNPGPINYAEIFPCGWCELKVDWSQSGIACDQCDHWYHRQCISMTSSVYNGIADTSWVCAKCNTNNCSSFLYNGFNLNVSNSYEALGGIPGDDSVFDALERSVSSPFLPPRHSSPAEPHGPSGRQGLASGPSLTPTSGPSMSSRSRSSAGSTQRSDTTRGPAVPAEVQTNFRVVTVNCNSVKGKQAELAQLLSYTDADAVLMTETKLDKRVKTAEFLPKN